MKITTERDILEYFPLALYSIATMARSGQSVELGMRFVADNNFGRVSLLFGQVLTVAKQQDLETGLGSIQKESQNPQYQGAMVVFRQYAQHGVSVSDQLIGIGRKMQLEAVSAKRQQLSRIKDALVPLTSILLIGFPFIIAIATALLVESGMVQEEPVVKRSEMEAFVFFWLLLLAVAYPLFYRSYIFQNPARGTPGLRQLRQMFRTETDAYVSRYLQNMADQIEMGMSLEMAASHAIPAPSHRGDRGKQERGLQGRFIEITSSSRSFRPVLYALSGVIGGRKFELTVRFLEMALDNKLMSIADMLRLLSESFWSTHITAAHYQMDIVSSVVVISVFKAFALLFVASLFPLIASVLLVFFLADLTLMGMVMI